MTPPTLEILKPEKLYHKNSEVRDSRKTTRKNCEKEQLHEVINRIHRLIHRPASFLGKNRDIL
jgi:hypothetical protein